MFHFQSTVLKKFEDDYHARSSKHPKRDSSSRQNQNQVAPPHHQERVYARTSILKSSSKPMTCSLRNSTPLLLYSDTLLEELVLPCSESCPSSRRGCYLFLLNIQCSKAISTKLMYWAMSLLFMPMSSTGSASRTNSHSICTASLIIVWRVPGKLVYELAVQQTGKIKCALITGDKLVGEGQSRHQSTLLEPEDAAERPAEKDALHHGKGDQTLSKRGVLTVSPLQSPVGLLCTQGTVSMALSSGASPGGHARTCRSTKSTPRSGCSRWQSGSQKQRASLDCISLLKLAAKFIDNAGPLAEEGQNVTDEMPLVCTHLLPVVLVIVGQVQLLCRPERRLGLSCTYPRSMQGEEQRVSEQERVRI